MLLQSKSSEGPKLQIPTYDNFLRFNAPDQLGGSSKGFRGRLQWSVACFGAGGTTWVYKYYPKISQAFPSFSFIRLTISMVLFSPFLRHLHQLTSPLLRLVIPLSQRMTSAWPIAKQCDWNIQTRLKNQMLRTTGIPWDSYRMVPKKTSCGLEKVRPRLCTRKSTRLCMRIFDSSLHANFLQSTMESTLLYSDFFYCTISSFTLLHSTPLYSTPLLWEWTADFWATSLLQCRSTAFKTSEILLYIWLSWLYSLYSTLQSTLLYATFRYSTVLCYTLLYFILLHFTFYILLLLYSILFHSNLLYSTLPYINTLLYSACGLRTSELLVDFLPVCARDPCAVPVCAREHERYWHILAPHPTPTPHDECAVPLCASEHEHYWHPPHPTPPPTPHDQCAVPACASEHERYWHPTPIHPNPNPTPPLCAQMSQIVCSQMSQKRNGIRLVCAEPILCAQMSPLSGRKSMEGVFTSGGKAPLSTSFAIGQGHGVTLQERFQRIRKAYALLSDEGSRELLLEAIEQEASCFAELSHGLI